MKELIKCDKTFTPGNRPDGIPNGVGFQLQDGTIVHYCADCIIEEGRKKKNENRAD